MESNYRKIKIQTKSEQSNHDKFLFFKFNRSKKVGLLCIKKYSTDIAI